MSGVVAAETNERTPLLPKINDDDDECSIKSPHQVRAEEALPLTPSEDATEVSPVVIWTVFPVLLAGKLSIP